MAIYKPKGHHEAFLKNPHGRAVGRKRSSKTAKAGRPRRKKKNPLLILGNPKRKEVQKTMAKKKRKSARSQTPVARKARRYSPRRHNPVMGRRFHRRHHRRQNPVLMGLTAGQIITAGASALLTTTVPSLVKAQKPLTKYGSQLATAIVGKFVADKVIKAGTGNTFLLVSIGVTAAQAAQEFLLKKVTMLTHVGPVEIPQGTPVKVPQLPAAPAAAAVHGMGAYAGELGAYLSDVPMGYQLGTVINQ